MVDFKVPQWAALPKQKASLISNDSTAYDLGNASHYLIGRDGSSCQVIIDDQSISRRHAAIVHHEDGRIYIIDLLSRTGVSLDGAPIPPNKPMKIRNGSRITVGPRTFTLQCEELAAPPPAATAGPSEVRASHLLVKHKDVRRPASWKEPVITRTREEAQAKIAIFQQQLISGEANFAELAAVESHCSSAKRGGDLGWFGHGQMMKEFEDAAFGLQVGEMSGPIETQSGVHLLLRTG